MADLDWQTANTADGVKVLVWFEEHIPREKWRRDESLRRAMLNWGLGSHITFGSLDRYLSKYGRHVSELPDDVWVRGYARQNHREPQAKRSPAAEITPKRCANPDCSGFVPFESGGKRRGPKEYARLKFCSRECGWASIDVSQARARVERLFKASA